MFSLWNLTRIFQPVVKRFKLQWRTTFENDGRRSTFLVPRSGLLRGICPPFQSQGWGICKLFCWPGARHLPTPGLFRSFWHAHGFLSEYNYTDKKQIGSSVKDNGLSRHVQGSKLKKSSSRLLTTNCRNIVARCKFLVGSLYNVNDTAH